MLENPNHEILKTEKLNTEIQRELVRTFFTDYEKGILRADIREEEILSLDDIYRYNLYYLCFMKSISVIPTVEMSQWINDNFNPNYDICGGAGNLGFSLGIPTSDSYFRLGSEFKERMGDLESHIGQKVIKPDFTTCRNTEKMTANSVARMENVNTVIGSWILVQHPNKTVNDAIKLIEQAKNNPNAIKNMNPPKKVAKMAETLMKKGKVGVPNGINLIGLLKNANLIFIGNSNIHTDKHIKELYSMHKHITYTYEDLPFFIIDKQWLKGNKSGGFIKFFKKYD